MRRTLDGSLVSGFNALGSQVWRQFSTLGLPVLSPTVTTSSYCGSYPFCCRLYVTSRAFYTPSAPLFFSSKIAAEGLTVEFEFFPVLSTKMGPELSSHVSDLHPE